MSVIKSIFGRASTKFTPASSEVNWTHVNTLGHGPGAGEERTPDGNSAVIACLMALATSYPEPDLKVLRDTDTGQSEMMDDHPLQALLDSPTPNGELSIDELLFWTSWAKHVDGNAYWLKVRSGDDVLGNVVELWPLSPRLVKPVSENRDWITYYKWQSAPNEITRLPVENIIHFRLGVDDRDHRLGIAPLKSLLRQISTD